MTGRSPRTIALDGPAAAGKSTVGRRVAEHLGHLYFDTGVLYRALTALAVERDIDPDDGTALAALARAHPIAVEARPHDDPGYAVLVDGTDVTNRLRGPAVDDAVSRVSRHAGVRAALLDRQREIAAAQPVVMIGRDIGTVVLPEADLKLFLDASPEARARRRFREQLADGRPVRYPDVLAAVRERDARDRGRATAQLAAASDALLVDTDRCGVDAVVAHVLAVVERWPERLPSEQRSAPCRPERSDR